METYTLIVTFESGKTATCHGSLFTLAGVRARIKEIEEKRVMLGMPVDAAIKFKITDRKY